MEDGAGLSYTTTVTVHVRERVRKSTLATLRASGIALIMATGCSDGRRNPGPAVAAVARDHYCEC